MSLWATLQELLDNMGTDAAARMPTLDEARYRIDALLAGDPVSERGPGMGAFTPTSNDWLTATLDAVTPVPVKPLMTVFHGTPHRWMAEPGYPQGRPLASKGRAGGGLWFADKDRASQYADDVLYRFDLPDKEIENLLRLDVPIGEQSPAIRSAFSDAPGDTMGSDLLWEIEKKYGSRSYPGILRGQGIPGIYQEVRGNPRVRIWDQDFLNRMPILGVE